MAAPRDRHPRARWFGVCRCFHRHTPRPAYVLFRTHQHRTGSCTPDPEELAKHSHEAQQRGMIGHDSNIRLIRVGG